jgi:hypothetical protein
MRHTLAAAAAVTAAAVALPLATAGPALASDYDVRITSTLLYVTSDDPRTPFDESRTTSVDLRVRCDSSQNTYGYAHTTVAQRRAFGGDSPWFHCNGWVNVTVRVDASSAVSWSPGQATVHAFLFTSTGDRVEAGPVTLPVRMLRRP